MHWIKDPALSLLWLGLLLWHRFHLCPELPPATGMAEREKKITATVKICHQSHALQLKWKPHCYELVVFVDLDRCFSEKI